MLRADSSDSLGLDELRSTPAWVIQTHARNPSPENNLHSRVGGSQ